MSTCDGDWLDAVAARAGAREPARALGAVAAHLAEAHGARVWFAEILGRRWSYLAGHRAELPSATPVERIPLGGSVGLVAASWGRLAPGQVARLLAWLRGLVAAGGGAETPWT